MTKMAKHHKGNCDFLFLPSLFPYNSAMTTQVFEVLALLICCLYFINMLFVYSLLNRKFFKKLSSEELPPSGSEFEIPCRPTVPNLDLPKGPHPHSHPQAYLGRIECCDDPHAVCIVVILNREIGRGDDARGASKVGITHAGCREEIKERTCSLDYIQLPIPPPASSPEETESVQSHLRSTQLPASFPKSPQQA
jgi:hypothetical protein